MEFKRAQEELSERGAATTCLDELIKCRLLHRTRRGETLRVELTHDVLTGVVRDSRNERRLRETREKAEASQREAEAMLLRRAEAERKAKDDAEASARPFSMQRSKKKPRPAATPILPPAAPAGLRSRQSSSHLSPSLPLLPPSQPRPLPKRQRREPSRQRKLPTS